MSQTYMPRLAAPVERTIPGAAAVLTAGVEQSLDFLNPFMPFADEGDA
jgi:hypothetical protein